MMRNSTGPPVVWSVAGFDPSSGAGITADLLTFAAHGLFGCSAITSLTAQSTLGVRATEAVRADFLAQTLSTLEADLPPAGIKIGMLHTPEIMRVVADVLRSVRSASPRETGQAQAPLLAPVVVLDPVLRSSSGHELYPAEGISEMKQHLLPLVDVITPNWSELYALAGLPVVSLDGAERGARALMATMPHLHVVVTGGDQARPTDLLLSPGAPAVRYEGEHIASRATHGTGCAFSSSLLAHLVRGSDLPAAVQSAKAFVNQAIRNAPGIGHGKGPMNLLWTRLLPDQA